MPSVRITLRISAEQYLNWYRGTAKSVVARDHAGQVVQFPARVLQRFVTPEGVRGTFELTYDEHSRFVSIERLW